MSNRIDFSIKDGIAKIVFNAPERRNAIDLTFLQKWLEAAKACAAKPSLTRSLPMTVQPTRR
jgi:enoyl-CoA hydratase/carnithine racemase